MFTKKTSNDSSRRARRVKAALSALLVGGGLGLASLYAAHAQHLPPCHQGELVNHYTGLCYVPVINCLPNRSNRCGS